jgi:hypothetical protein
MSGAVPPRPTYPGSVNSDFFLPLCVGLDLDTLVVISVISYHQNVRNCIISMSVPRYSCNPTIDCVQVEEVN